MSTTRIIDGTRSTVVAALAILFSGCSGGEDQSLLVSVRSQQVLSEPPDVELIGNFDADWHYSTTNTSGSVTFLSEDGVEAEVTIALPNAVRILGATIREHGGNRYLVCSAIDSQEVLSVFRLHDLNGDDVPDASSIVELFDSGTEPLYVTSLSWSPNGDLYLLDRRCQDVLVAADTNQDGWPDTLRAIPFAKSEDFAQLLEARSIASEIAQAVHTIPDTETYVRRVVPYWQFEDVNGDAVADTATKIPAGGLGIRVKGMPFDGQSSIEVAGQPGKTVEVWTVDGAGDNDTLLGSATVDPGSLEFFTPVSLSPGLQLGQQIRVQYSNDAASGRLFVASKDWPQITGVEGLWVEVGDSGGTIAIEGMNFTSSMKIKMATVTGNEYTLTTTYIDSEHATGAIPSLSEDERHNVADFWVCVPGQPVAEQHACTVQLCPPESSGSGGSSGQ